MSFTLTDITDDDNIGPETIHTSVGCLILDDEGGWNAVCPGLGFQLKGKGVFDGLPTDALWILNRDFKTVRPLQEGNPGLRLKLHSWMRISMDDMLREWGVEDVETTANAELIASIFSRVHRISFEAMRKSGFSRYVKDADLYAAIGSSPSLATGLRNGFDKQMRASVPKDPKIQKSISEALGYGVTRLQASEVRDGEFLIHCRIPRLTHAYRVSGYDVPAAGSWKKAELNNGATIRSSLADLKNLGKPVMVIGSANERPGVSHDYFGAWVRPNNKAIRRMSYTLEEVEALLPYFDMDDCSIIVGPDWKKTVTGKMIANLIEVAGGRQTASTMWSANVAAENILCGGFRKLSGSESLSPECVWMTARDRLEMIGPVTALMDCGATLVSAYAGGIIIKVPADPEMIALVANVIWEMGLQMPIGTVNKMIEMGIEPPFDPETYGGASEDLILGELSHRCQRNAMWIFDQIIDQPEKNRAAALASVLE